MDLIEVLSLTDIRQVHYRHYQSPAYGAIERPHGLQSYSD